MKPTRREKLLFAMDEGDLPPRTETREQRLQRILGGDVGKVCKPASAFTFTRERAAEASRRAAEGGR